MCSTFVGICTYICGSEKTCALCAHPHKPHIQGGFFNWSALKMTKSQTLRKFWHLELFWRDLHVIWHLVIFWADQLKKPPCMTKDNVEVSSKQDNKCFNDEGPRWKVYHLAPQSVHRASQGLPDVFILWQFGVAAKSACQVFKKLS